MNPARITRRTATGWPLDQSALLDLREALKLADVDDRIRSATEALIEAELTAVRDSLRMSAASRAPRSATGTAAAR